MVVAFIIFVSLFPSIEALCAGCGSFGYCLNKDNATGACVSCACPEGYEGECCDISPPDGCSSSPCPKDGGYYECISYANGGFKCLCIEGFYGPSCNITSGK